MLYITESQPGSARQPPGPGPAPGPHRTRGARSPIPKTAARLSCGRIGKGSMAAGIELSTKAIKPRPRRRAPAQPAPRTLSLQPINTNVSFRDQAYSALKQAIMDADIYAHREELRLDERQLSQALGVSRTPIREAMTLLEQEGFLRSVPRRGVFIIRKTKKQIVEMIEMWAALESMAARLATIN